MRTVNEDALAALEAGEAVIVQLVKFEFSTGTVRRNTSNWKLSYLGDDYLGAQGLELEPVTDDPDEMAGMVFTLTGLDATLIALALDEQGVVQGTPVTVYCAVLHKDTYAILDVVVDWVGTLDPMTVAETSASGSVSARAESKGVDLLRGTPLTYTDGDQQSLYPGDRAFEYVVSQVDKPVVWPSREYFFK